MITQEEKEELLDRVDSLMFNRDSVEEISLARKGKLEYKDGFYAAISCIYGIINHFTKEQEFEHCEKCDMYFNKAYIDFTKHKCE